MHSSSIDDKRNGPGQLYVVATPLGNLEDITIRAINILKSSDFIAAEDTRHTAKLLNAYDIRTKLISLHEHNESKKSDQLISDILAGKTIALVSDAGTPTVSDPGFVLINTAIKNNIQVIPIPGPSAAVTAMSVSGLPTDSFVFYGFLPGKEKKRHKILNELDLSDKPFVFYESPKRIKSLIREMIDFIGDRPAVLAREMTKMHEEYIRGTLQDIEAILGRRPTVKGECTLIIGGALPAEPVSDDFLKAEIVQLLSLSTMKTKEIATVLAEKYAAPKKRVYDLVLESKAKGI